ncbi:MULTISPECIES: acyl-CoA carboxylase subunit beta [Croceibacter]|jgi:acetyl-CoA carboxylase carboxyltransferase component|uniref:Propionyl-CoA carboxylase, beta subunit n=1 Tax=Croceibacter atlanticus (strain ATCC BAA-628 / JCM 21780 / CIP 108009 / IAM 15332 / KCTC 12090 / HTCC2559) TaxID=216432 RepID=A3UBM0_CROAH|nr:MULTISPECIES: carboxyl transferase domain-containing protein [Croceibacter]HAT70858.1 methylcrotonoyl-CoA carboxylase [Flavobacteriaceae bacterium]EAP86021.1 propionyl-CoA carboxylase, beta subunit [Croceibacter atlanticus HTCC2559]MAM22187.1 methylcrotonoyl-CoA carboxylase [Croceibacter sp.]MBG26412.1 methylcrotonoyl-CoA carboxylase [Croceibacter sp.]MBW4969132.1 acyl-CoA carboxylase subunit beta [Croceibacter atlanticus]|tara:strand:+ start:7967 stop:9595 length:1629 start_codon:yes stop_codon:yes gene_type:complete
MDINFNKNEDVNKLKVSNLRDRLAKIKLGGGEKRIEKHHAKGKMTARERINYLLDDHEAAIEIGAFAADGMYEDHGGCPSAGVVIKIGHVKGKQCIVVANDATVKAGAWFPMTGKKNLRAQEIAMENRLPIIYLVDSAGVYLPMQDEIFPDKEHFGRIFRNNAVMSSMGITQISAVMGSCVAGGAYLPIMSDEALIVDKTGSIFLAGSYLVKAAIGETIDNETLGGATTHCEISGVTDYKSKDDKDALDTIKNIMDKIGDFDKAGFNRKKAQKPSLNQDEIFGILPKARHEQYDMMEIISRLVDNSEFEAYKDGYGQTIITGYARIDGWAVGIVANQRKIVKTKKGEMQFGGVIYSDSADKATRFIANCNQKKIPLVFLQDVTGFMVGSKSEHGGIIKDGAKLVNAVSNSVVPKFTIVIGNSYGAGNYAMCGKAYDPRLIAAWPTAELAVMSGNSAAKVLLQIETASLKKQGKTITKEKEDEMFKKIKDRYDEQVSPYYAASRLWTDAVINPLDTRKWISHGIEAANHAPIEKKFNLGVLQV